METKMDKALEQMQRDANYRYNALYDNGLYRAATPYIPPLSAPKPVSKQALNRAFRLQDAALALCGSPYERIDPAVKWTKEEQAFLDLFV